jgi:hypothetical protein
MAADQERAERIRALKQERPDLTWRRIADHVGVSERSATDWQRKGGMEYDNAKKLAELFEVDVDYIWRGTESATPEPFANGNGSSVEDRLEQLADQIAHDRADREANITEVKNLIQAQNELLATQERILEEIRDATAKQQDAAHRLERMTQEAVEAMPARPARAPRRAPSGTRSGS